MKISKNKTFSAVTINSKDYLLFLFEDILQTSVKKIFVKVIQYIIFEDLHINNDNKNSPTLFFDILYYTTIIDEDSALGFRLEMNPFSCPEK